MSTTLWVVLFDVDGTTPLKQLGYATGVRWLDELDAEGSFSFSVPVEEAGDLEVGSIVKFALGNYSSEYVFAGVVDTVKLEKAGATTGGVSRVYDVSGRGVRARLEDAVVYPSGGETTRTFSAASAGSILRTLVLEAQARGALAGFTLSFTASVDSNGDAYTDTLNIEEQVGATISQVAANLQELICDVWVDPDLTINVVNHRGDDLTVGVNPVTLRVGGSVSELSEELAGPIRNTVLIASGTNGETFTTRTNAGSVSTYGRRETFVSLANTSDAAVVTLAGDQVLNTSATPADGVTVQLDPTGPQAYLDFAIGDLVYLVDGTGTKTSYRVRSLTVTQDDAGLLSFVPELGTARADLDKRLRRALERVERGNAGGDTDIGVAPEPEGGTEFELGTVIEYDPITGEGLADVDGVETEFYNTTPWSFEPGDDIILGGIGGTSFAFGLETPAGGSGPGAGGSQFGFIPPRTVPGLPYNPGIDFAAPWFAHDEFLVENTGGRVINFVTATTFTLPIPSGFGLGVGFGGTATGTYVFRRLTLSTTNSLFVITNGVGTTYNYGNVAIIGISNGLVYALATHKTGSSNPRVITITSAGVVSDFTATFNRPGGGTTALNFQLSSSNVERSGAGPWGIAWNTDSTPTRTQVLAHGSTTGNDWDVNFDPFIKLAVDNTYVYGLGGAGDRSYRRLDPATGVVTQYDDALPVGGQAQRIANYINTGRLAITGRYDDGSGAVPALFTTAGTGVTTTTYPDSDYITLHTSPSGLLIGARQLTGGAELIIGVALSEA